MTGITMTIHCLPLSPLLTYPPSSPFSSARSHSPSTSLSPSTKKSKSRTLFIAYSLPLVLKFTRNDFHNSVFLKLINYKVLLL